MGRKPVEMGVGGAGTRIMLLVGGACSSRRRMLDWTVPQTVDACSPANVAGRPLCDGIGPAMPCAADGRLQLLVA